MTDTMASTYSAWTTQDDDAVRTARALTVDAVERAGHGHPGTAMALAPVAHLLFQHVMRHDPSHSAWPGRDRLVLSCGHASLLLYTQFYLTGYGLTLEDIRAYRKFGSLTPAHPERGHTNGVEVTTGPLGQGLAQAVGMAMAARRDRARYDNDAPAGRSTFDHRVFVLCSDGDVQEGVTAEAASLAGLHRLGNLVVVYDDNHITIEGDISLSMREDVAARFAAYGWHVVSVDLGSDGDVDVLGLERALQVANEETDRPSLIVLRSTIAYPAPAAQNTAASHGSKLGAAEAASTLTALGFDADSAIEPDDAVLAYTQRAVARGERLRRQWEADHATWRDDHADLANELDRLDSRLPRTDLIEAMPSFPAGKAIATRKAFGACLAAVAPLMPELWGGSADLGDSNMTTVASEAWFQPEVTDEGGPTGRLVHWGIREHAMAAALNGIAQNGRSRPYGGTSLTFSDYQRPAIRLAALMGLPVLHVWTHDSIGLGEDGATHQPVEQLTSLRAVPGLDIVRPADGPEPAVVLDEILRRNHRPAGLVLSRQDLPVPDRTQAGWRPAEGARRGAYTLWDSAVDDDPEVILLATGSEVSIALAAAPDLAARGIPTRVVSAPCLEWFAEQDQDYRDSVLPPHVTARVSVEAGIASCWWKLLGSHGRAVSIEEFGTTGPAPVLFDHFGLNADAVIQEALASRQGSAPQLATR